MKLRITKLKAAWPSGAKVGDIVELPSVPAWAVGKCEPAPDDAQATVIFPKKAKTVGGALPSIEAVEARVADAERAVQEAQAIAVERTQKLADAEAALAASKAESDELRTKLADAEAALASATAKSGKR